MTEYRLLFRFLDRDFLFKLIFLMLLYSLVPLAEIFLFIYLSPLIGNFLILALAAIIGLIGVLIAARQITTLLKSLKEKIKNGQYPGQEFVDLAGILVGSLFLLTPGFITDFFGFLLLVPPIRRGFGRLIVRRMESRLTELYEYLRLSDWH